MRGVVAHSAPEPRTRLTAHGPELIFPGHYGTIYQAKGMNYLGKTRPRRLTMLPDGSVLHDRAMSKVRTGERSRGGVERRLVALGARPRDEGEPSRAWLEEALQAVGARVVSHGGQPQVRGLHRAAHPPPAHRHLLPVPEGRPRGCGRMSAVSRTGGEDVELVINWGLGVDSTTYLVKMLEDPAAHGVDLARTMVLHDLTGSDWPTTRAHAAIGKSGHWNLSNAPCGEDYGLPVCRFA